MFKVELVTFSPSTRVHPRGAGEVGECMYTFISPAACSKMCDSSKNQNNFLNLKSKPLANTSDSAILRNKLRFMSLQSREQKRNLVVFLFFNGALQKKLEWNGFS